MDTAIPSPKSGKPEPFPMPPKYEEYAKSANPFPPGKFILEMKPTPTGLDSLGCRAPCTIGKSNELVPPVTYALPAESVAIPNPMSPPVPPKNVEYWLAGVPVVSIRETKATPLVTIPAGGIELAVTGKLDDKV